MYYNKYHYVIKNYSYYVAGTLPSMSSNIIPRDYIFTIISIIYL